VETNVAEEGGTEGRPNHSGRSGETLSHTFELKGPKAGAKSGLLFESLVQLELVKAVEEVKGGRGGITAAIELLRARMEVSKRDKLTAEPRGQGSSGSKGTLLAGVGHGKDGGSVAG